MKYLFPLLILLISCCKQDIGKDCAYDLDYPGHFIRIPVTITPHQLEYKVGDTMRISTVFSDSIYDLGTQQTFKIEDFPFKPTSLLFYLNGQGGHGSGYTLNELSIDSIYSPYFWQSAQYADGFNAKTIYDHQDDEYRFESTLVLTKTGRYILLFSDIYRDYAASGNSNLNADADAITFEGKCLEYYPCSMIDSGDDHLDKFEKELIYLDQVVYGGALRHDGRDSQDPLYPGSFSVEFSGFFGFEVLE